VITRVTVRLIPLPAHRRFEAVGLPSLQAGLDALRRVMQSGMRPAVIRFYDAEASGASLSKVVGRPLKEPVALLMFEGEREVADAEAEVTLRHLTEAGGALLDPEICRTWWDRRYDFYHPPHYPTLPSMWGTIDAVAPYGGSSTSTRRSARRWSRSSRPDCGCGPTSATGTSGARWSTRAS
jgi:alkyldihydroxyacetonephosphate synthase